MFLFILFAVVVWYAAGRWRRTWRSFLVVALAQVCLFLVSYGHYQLNLLTDGAIYLPVLQVLLVPYSLAVLAVSFFIACLPPRPDDVLCRHCGYSLHGLHPKGVICPECGTTPRRLAKARPQSSPSQPQPVALPSTA